MTEVNNAAQPASPEAGVIRARLFQHQREGLNFMLHREIHGDSVKGGIIADEPGLGKTLQTIACIASNPGNAPTLIVAPKTLLEMWKNEIKRFYPGVACSIFSKKDFDKINSADLSRLGHSIIVTSYGTIRNNITVNLTEFHRIVLDEAHAIKNPYSKITNTCYRLRSTHKWVLTGTPVTKDASDFRSLLRFIGEDVATLSMRHLTSEVLQDLRSKYVLRRTFDELGARCERLRLPPLEIINHEVELSQDEKNVYNNLVKFGRYSARVADQMALDGEDRREAVNNIFEILLRMNQTIFSPKLIEEKIRELKDTFFVIDMGLIRDPDEICSICLDEEIPEICKTACGHVFCKSCLATAMHYKKKCPMCRSTIENGSVSVLKCDDQGLDDDVEFGESTKVRKVKEIVSNSGEKTLVFCHWHREMDLVLDAVSGLNVPVMKIDGKTPGPERQAVCDAFNAHEGQVVLVLQINCACTGLNLQGATSVIFTSFDWQATNETQAIARAHRIGQTNRVTVHRITAKNSIDHYVSNTQQRKLGIASHILGDDKIQGKLGRVQMNNIFQLFSTIV
jgi:SNF2 family DNA or RNA helicase